MSDDDHAVGDRIKDIYELPDRPKNPEEPKRP